MLHTQSMVNARVPARRHWQRKVLCAAALGMLVTLGLGVAYHRPLVSRLVTELAFRDASEIAGKMPAVAKE